MCHNSGMEGQARSQHEIELSKTEKKEKEKEREKNSVATEDHCLIFSPPTMDPGTIVRKCVN